MKTKRYLHNGLECEYHVIGKGERVLYCFHGFGGTMYDWEVFLPWLENTFTIYSFHDFFHGSTNFPEARIASKPLTKIELSNVYESFARINGHDEINIMAFSSGGRTALTLIELAKLTIDKVWLFAPDGLKISFWNKMFCSYSIIQNTYQRFIENPDSFFHLLRVLVKFKMIKRDLAKFIFFSMRTEDKRRLIYQFWMTYREVMPNKDLLIRSINENVGSIYLVMGKRDQLIPSKIASAFRESLEKKIDLLIVDEGHLLLNEKHVALYKDKFPIK